MRRTTFEKLQCSCLYSLIIWRKDKFRLAVYTRLVQTGRDVCYVDYLAEFLAKKNEERFRFGTDSKWFISVFSFLLRWSSTMGVTKNIGRLVAIVFDFQGLIGEGA